MTATAITAAEYTAGKQPQVNINIIKNGRRSWVATYRVTGKREARKVAAQFNAQPWNF